MNPAILAYVDKLPAILAFVATCIEQGKPVVETAIELAKASDDPEAKKALAKLRAAYEASDKLADEALEKVLRDTD